MDRKKILIGLIACMFLASMIPNIIGEQNVKDYTFQERRYINQKDLKGIYTERGIEKLPNSRGKPGAYVTITNPTNGATVSGSVTITIKSNYNPTISIDGSSVGSGLSWNWDTTAYSDGSHIITASARGITDTVTVTVDNGGGPVNIPPTADFSYSKTDLTVVFTDQSIDTDGIVVGWSWNFGDGNSSIAQNPSHTYATAGTYTVSLIVTDDDDATDSTSQSVAVSTGGSVDKYALVIGISDYEGTGSDLQYCDDDAQDWKAFLQGQGYTVDILLDNQATADNIISAINDLIFLEDEDDYVVFAYSGHGATLTGYGSCIVSHDMYGVDHGYVESLFDNAESQHIFFSFDACVIGDFQGLVDANSIGAFASNRRNSYDGDSSMKNGVFTYYQMDGWDNHNFDNFEDDSAYAVQKMKDWAPRFIKVDPFYKDLFTGLMFP
jgi:PKD repeat protein